MSVKMWKNLSKQLQTTLSKNLDKETVESVMETLENDKSNLLKVVSTTESKRKTKDPNAPKKALTSYIFYCNDVREQVKQNNPDMKATDITRELGRMWSELSQNKRKKYDKMAEEDKVRYQNDMSNYTPPDDVEVPATKTRKKRENTGPKKPMTAYLFYCNDARDQVKKEHPDLKATEVTKVMGERWRSLADEEKQLFVDLAQKDRERFERECEEAGLEVKQPRKPKAKAVEKTEEKSEEKKPKKRGGRKKVEVEPEEEEEELLEEEEEPAPKKKRGKKTRKGSD